MLAANAGADLFSAGRASEGALASPFNDEGTANLIVTSFQPTDSGFVATFNQEVQANLVNLYDSVAANLGESDVVLRSAMSGPVAGSIVFGANRRQLTFVKTGGPLADDNYAVTLRSADDGFQSVAGTPLDGDQDGISADDFNETFQVQSALAGAVTVSLPDVVRGPGQGVNLPASSASGIPLSLSKASVLVEVELQIDFNPNLLIVVGARPGDTMPAGSSVTLTPLSEGSVRLVFSTTTPVIGNDVVFAHLETSVPAENATGVYGSSGVFDLNHVSVRDLRDLDTPVIADDALHSTTYIADVTGNGRVNGSDASQIARYAALLDTGFASLPLVDPILLADISGNGRVNAADATWAALLGAGHELPGVPAIPATLAATVPMTAGSAMTGPPRILVKDACRPELAPRLLSVDPTSTFRSPLRSATTVTELDHSAACEHAEPALLEVDPLGDQNLL